MRRIVPIVLAACLLMILPGCKSNNAGGKLVGTWVSTSSPNGVSMTWTFAADGSFTVTAQGPGGSKTITGKYRTSWGDTVYMDHLSEKVGGQDILKDDITITGNQMTARDPDGTTTTFMKR